jgi:hypothetical protein
LEFCASATLAPGRHVQSAVQMRRNDLTIGSIKTFTFGDANTAQFWLEGQ